MNLFRDYISDPLYEVAIKILSSSHLFEMAHQRKDAIAKMQVIASRLAEKMVMVHHAQDSRDLPHWKTTLNAHLIELHKLTFLAGKKRLPQSDITSHVFDAPFGDYNDYMLHHNGAGMKKNKTQFSPATPEDYDVIKRKYSRLLPVLAKSPLPQTYDSLLDS